MVHLRRILFLISLSFPFTCSVVSCSVNIICFDTSDADDDYTLLIDMKGLTCWSDIYHPLLRWAPPCKVFLKPSHTRHREEQPEIAASEVQLNKIWEKIIIVDNCMYEVDIKMRHPTCFLMQTSTGWASETVTGLNTGVRVGSNVHLMRIWSSSTSSCNNAAMDIGQRTTSVSA